MKSLFLALAAALFLMIVAKPTTVTGAACDPSYPGVCIPSPPPDLDCGDISHRNFRVVGSDPHRFDGDKDGIGCETRR
ncbi:hypothetical protein [Pseudanabaena sp. FACHB-2040]|uniref:hypothetical protein n=1 Tax=Pseudanabaena sp. FACHB-2040 TaxID=2692859 RepID=UPI0018EF787F|nr:hypothetical protein [Pseudanabaena sp. FACHB-2040]